MLPRIDRVWLFAFLLVVTFLAVVAWQRPVFSQERPPIPELKMTFGCVAPEQAQRMLSGMAPVVAGIDGDGDLWIIHMSEGGSWVITVTVGDGRVCGMVGNGRLRLALPGRPA